MPVAQKTQNTQSIVYSVNHMDFHTRVSHPFVFASLKGVWLFAFLLELDPDRAVTPFREDAIRGTPASRPLHLADEPASSLCLVDYGAFNRVFEH